ncbi:zinc-dependent alcohol dehydrogenase [Sphaerisporangium corydalis]|uniref:Zinc-binding dehydrogenase n=1 Tax=Sphaerisporangium corydalis TaxID=1441875 RepID=A0ABV9EFX8_9ACTN|nr:alcohol dehydrogenase catalytic domain-containing protein [Sphaerisporangium corydalis]
MRAVVLRGPGRAGVEEVADPAPEAGQAVVDVHRVGICGTDHELFTGTMAYYAQGKASFPLRPGHEWAGVVAAVGAGVAGDWIGARVTGDTMLGCGRCPRCLGGHGHVCAFRSEVGILGGWPGALAEKVCVPVTSLHRLPDSVDDQAGALVEPGGNAWRAASAAGARPGVRVLVCGPGTIGLLTAAFARAAGAEVHVLGLDRRNQELAEKLGADRFWTLDEPPGGTFEAVVDCTDDPGTPPAALELVEPAGRVVHIGLAGTPSVIDTRALVLKDVTAVGILGGSPGLAPAIGHYAEGRVTPGPLVAATMGLEGAVDALAGVRDGAPGTKIHIDPRL